MSARSVAAFPELFSEGYTALVERYGAVASEIGAQQFSEWANELGIRAQVVTAAGVDPVRAAARSRWALTQSNQAGNLSVLVDELVRQPYRSTIADSAVSSGAGWARVPRSAHPCAFCSMLASRGAVYHSASSAGGFGGKKYHGDCGCEPVLVRGPEDFPAGYNPDDLYDAYRLAREASPSTDPHAVLSTMRAREGTN